MKKMNFLVALLLAWVSFCGSPGMATEAEEQYLMRQGDLYYNIWRDIESERKHIYVGIGPFAPLQIRAEIERDQQYAQRYYNLAMTYYERANSMRRARLRAEEADRINRVRRHLRIHLLEDLSDATVVINNNQFIPGNTTVRDIVLSGASGPTGTYRVRIEILRNQTRILSNAKTVTLRNGAAATNISFTEIDFPQ